MKKLLLVLSLIIFSATAIYGKEPDSTYRFKHYMHEIFKNYRNTNISIDMRQYDLAGIHTKYFLENISKVPEFTADLAAAGVTLDQAVFMERLGGLRERVTELRTALKTNDPKKIKKLQPDVLQACIGCHTQAKLKWLFRLPMPANLFEEYMHEISDNITQAGELMEANEFGKAEDYAQIANQYLTLLKNLAPYKGPSGVIMDRRRYLEELKSAEGFLLLLTEDFKEKKPADVDSVKNHLNKVCVACHEPGKIK